LTVILTADQFAFIHEKCQRIFANSIFAVSLQNERLYAATDGNAIESYLFEDGQPDGVLSRFSAPATHMCFSSSGSVVVVGAR